MTNTLLIFGLASVQDMKQLINPTGYYAHRKICVQESIERL